MQILVTPDGYDTMMGERGLMLSGGEKQGAAITTPIQNRPRIVIFDEATRAVESMRIVMRQES